MIGIAQLSMYEINQVIDHFEMYLNKPIKEKNKEAKENAPKYKQDLNDKMKQKDFKSPLEQFDRIGRFKPKVIKQKLIF